MVNLGDLVPPLMDWVGHLIPQGRSMANDLYDCRGIAISAVCDYNNIGNADNICFPWTGPPHGSDRSSGITGSTAMTSHIFVTNSTIPERIGTFYEDFLVRDRSGRLVPCQVYRLKCLSRAEKCGMACQALLQLTWS